MGKGPRCGYVFRGEECSERGTHYCELRADRAVAFFNELLVHTTGPFARQRFVLSPWQENEIVRPLFGEVWWSSQWARYVRRYTTALICMARKNGKSALIAGLVLLLLIGDDEDAAEVYGGARDTKQAGKVYEPVKRMVRLSPLLSERLVENKSARRIFDERTSSYYELVTADELGELGHNPHGFVLDEALAQRDSGLWDAMRTAAGARAQPMRIVITTETNDPSSFGAALIDEAVAVQRDPRARPHVFAFVRRLPRTEVDLEELHQLFEGHPDLPVSIDAFDERNWPWANPALGDFLSLEALREEASDAKDDPTKENAFRQYRCNQRVTQVTRWLPLHVWDGTAGMVVPEKLAGRSCWAGLDLASTSDLASWVLAFPPDDDAPDDPWEVLYRFWTPEAKLPMLDRATGGLASVWAREGLLSVTEGDWIDYHGDPVTGRSHNDSTVPDPLAIHPQIAKDRRAFRIRAVGYDAKEATATGQWMQAEGMTIVPIYQGFGLSPALKELERLVRAGRWHHGGNPVARWNADSAEVKTDDQERLKLVKPARRASGKRVDGIAASANSIRVAQLDEAEVETPLQIFL